MLNLSVDGEKTGSIKTDMPPTSKGIKVVLNRDLSKADTLEDKIVIDQTDENETRINVIKRNP